MNNSENTTRSGDIHNALYIYILGVNITKCYRSHSGFGQVLHVVNVLSSSRIVYLWLTNTFDGLINKPERPTS